MNSKIPILQNLIIKS